MLSSLDAMQMAKSSSSSSFLCPNFPICHRSTSLELFLSQQSLSLLGFWPNVSVAHRHYVAERLRP